MADKTLWGFPRAASHLEVASRRWSTLAALSPRLLQPPWRLCTALVTWCGTGQLWVMLPQLCWTQMCVSVQSLQAYDHLVLLVSKYLKPLSFSGDFQGRCGKANLLCGLRDPQCRTGLKKNNSVWLKNKRTVKAWSCLSWVLDTRLWLLHATAKARPAWKSGQQTLAPVTLAAPCC